MACPAGVSVLSAKAPAMTQSKAAAGAASRFRVNCRAIDQIPGAGTYNHGFAHSGRRPAAGVRKRIQEFIGLARPMPKLDRYLLRDFVQSFLATLIVLLTVSLGGVLVDVLGEIADGGIPARLLLSQLGLQLLVYLPLVLPLALMLGLMLAVARLYRDSEMAVLNAVGVGPRR